MKIDILTLDEVLNVLADWDLKHKARIYEDSEHLEGLTDPNKSTIYIADDNFKAERLYTLIHELIHASDVNRGYNSPERDTVKRTNRSYRTLFGNDFMK